MRTRVPGPTWVPYAEVLVGVVAALAEELLDYEIKIDQDGTGRYRAITERSVGM
jgi:hypothetical protein